MDFREVPKIQAELLKKKPEKPEVRIQYTAVNELLSLLL
jgi:hypothetical protein